MIYIGLDISTKTGLAVINTDHPNYEGITVTTAFITSKYLGIKRADDITKQCMAFIKSDIPCPVTNGYKIMIEGYGFARTQHLQPLFEVGTVLRYCLFLKNYSYIEVPPTSLKKFVTGKGNVKKEMMLKEVYKRWKIDCDTNDEADAVGLAYMGMALDGNLKLPKINMEALKKIHVDKETVTT